MEAKGGGMIAGAARTATQDKAGTFAKAYMITVGKDGKVFLRER